MENITKEGGGIIANDSEARKVGLLSELIALENGILPKSARQIRIAAALHDIGKLKIPEIILSKPDKLTAREFDIMKTHTILGAQMLKSLQGNLGEMARLCCEFHHEWFDGRGYWGRYISDLPQYISFVSISDVFAALASKRPYKEAWPPDEAIRYIQNNAGTQFCPKLVDMFSTLIQGSSVPDIFNWRKENEQQQD